VNLAALAAALGEAELENAASADDASSQTSVMQLRLRQHEQALAAALVRIAELEAAMLARSVVA
jgi:hypothetical protein